MAKNKITRRGFISSAVAMWTSVLSLPFIYSVFRYLSPSERRFRPYSERTGMNGLESRNREINLENLKEDSFVITRVEGKPVIVIRKSGSNVVALSAECTHLRCIVGYRKSFNDVFCSCHGGSFDLEGKVTGGPPKRPLTKFQVRILGNTVSVFKL